MILLVLLLLCFATAAHAQRPPAAIVPPVAIEGSQVQPSYPDSARRLGIQGTTTLRVHVLADGKVGDVNVEQSAGHPELDQAAVDAARRWRFQPARRGTEPVPVWIRLAMKFTVRDGPDPDLARAVKAGVVTTVDGNVTAQRVNRPLAVPLRANDDLLIQDTITTGNAARIEMRLGGKMDVELRERSAVTITERPPRSSLDLEAGQLTIHLQGDRMQPGEAIDVRTPNAVVTLRSDARVRVEAASPKQGEGSVVTHVDVLEGLVSVAASYDFRNPLLYRGTPAAGLELRANHAITITGDVLGVVRKGSGN